MHRVRLSIVALVLSAPTLLAMYVRPELERVPLDRVIANLTRAVDASPNDAAAQLNLGRAHAMAWAASAPDVEVMGKTGDLWFGFEPKHVPLAGRTQPPSPEARRHLDQAVEHHRLAAKWKPDDPIMQLGYAWCLDQAGRTGEAVALYRRIIAAAWATEGKAASASNFPSWRSVTAEAAGYLLPHLDGRKDAAEIADLKTKLDYLVRLPRPITPIVVPIDDRATPADLVDPKTRVSFDLDGSGRADAWQWITPRAGWLVYDHDGAGRIDSGLQLFGSVTFWMFWRNGYEALAALDDDGDGALAGNELRLLALWIDADGDGRSDPGEVRALQEHGIVALATTGVAGNASTIAAWSPRGVTLANGDTRPTFDVLLRRAVPDRQPEPTDATGEGDPSADLLDAISPRRTSAPHLSARW